jgi:hypothetical protein
VFEDPQHCLLSLIANECLLETLLALGWFLIEYMKNMNKVKTKFKIPMINVSRVSPRSP